MSWIFSPSSPLATRVHRYKVESVAPRLAVAFAVGIGCGFLFRGLPEPSDSAVATKPAASYAASLAKEGAARASASASTAARTGSDDTNTGAREKPDRVAAASGEPVRSAAAEARPAEAKPSAGPAPVALTPVPMPVGRPVLAGAPPEHEEVKQSEPVRQAEVDARQETEEVAALRPADPPSEAKPARRADTKRARARARAKPPRDAERELESEGLRYVGTRVMPDGSRLPVYRRVESRRSSIFGFWDRDDRDAPRRIRLFD